MQKEVNSNLKNQPCRAWATNQFCTHASPRLAVHTINHDHQATIETWNETHDDLQLLHTAVIARVTTTPSQHKFKWVTSLPCHDPFRSWHSIFQTLDSTSAELGQVPPRADQLLEINKPMMPGGATEHNLAIRSCDLHTAIRSCDRGTATRSYDRGTATRSYDRGTATSSCEWGTATRY